MMFRYFDYLRKAKNYKSSSLWAIHSRVKNCHLRRHGTDPKWKRVYAQLQSYEADYEVKTANVFTLDEVQQVLQLDKYTPVWVMRKALTAVAICGGLRCCEVRKITLRDVVVDEEGAWITFRHGKQRGPEKVNEFIVPFDRSKPHLCYATRLVDYMDKVKIVILITNPHNMKLNFSLRNPSLTWIQMQRCSAAQPNLGMPTLPSAATCLVELGSPSRKSSAWPTHPSTRVIASAGNMRFSTLPQVTL